MTRDIIEVDRIRQPDHPLRKAIGYKLAKSEQGTRGIQKYMGHKPAHSEVHSVICETV